MQSPTEKLDAVMSLIYHNTPPATDLDINALLYPSIEPFESGLLDTGDGHQVYWERCGNPKGKPAIFLHGGPGGGCAPTHRRLFNPEQYCITLFDQRGCGRSLPHASLENNTTDHLIVDIEALRQRFNVPRWLVFGGSWGSTLALAYAQAHPQCVSELVLRGIFTLRPEELHWFYQEGASWVYPDHWSDFIAPIAPERRHELTVAYREILTGPDPVAARQAALAWSIWEGRTIGLMPTAAGDQFTDPHFAFAFARIENHYFMHQGFMQPNQLINNAQRLRDIPTCIVQGRYDMCTPMKTAWDLYQAMQPHAHLEMHVIANAGHKYSEPGILQQLMAATERFAAPSNPA